jgi:hypothetical protein
MDYGKVLFDGFEFDDDSQGTVRASLDQDLFDFIVGKHSNDVSIVRYGDVYYKPINPVEDVDKVQANIFFRVNFETNELRFCAEATFNKQQPPLFFSHYHMHSVVVEENILRRGFDYSKATPDLLPQDNPSLTKFLVGNDMFKTLIPRSDFKRVLTINIKRHLCYGFERPLLLDEIIVIGLDKKREAFREAIFFGDTVTDMESSIYAFKQLLAEEGVQPDYASFSRFNTASLLLLKQS